MKFIKAVNDERGKVEEEIQNNVKVTETLMTETGVHF